MGEKQFYKTVQKWLEDKGYYCGGGMTISGTKYEYFYQDLGTSKMRVDVAGVKNVGSKYADSIEVVCVEVKDSSSVKFSDIVQAYGYSAIANRIYLAHTAQLDEYWERFLRRLGLGFLEIHGVRKGVTERVPSNFFHPHQANLLEFLRSLRIVQCTLCGTFTFKWDTIHQIDGESYLRFERKMQIDLHRDASTNPYDDIIPTSRKIKRYLCRDCLEDFYFEEGKAKIDRRERKWKESD